MYIIPDSTVYISMVQDRLQGRGKIVNKLWYDHFTFICEWCKRSVEAQIYDETVNWVHSFSLDFETITGSNFVLNTSDAMMALWIGWLIGLSWESILGIKLIANDNCRSYDPSSRQGFVNKKTRVFFQAVPTAKDRAILVTKGGFSADV